jgi:hypothetical protein
MKTLGDPRKGEPRTSPTSLSAAKSEDAVSEKVAPGRALEELVAESDGDYEDDP